MTNPHNSNTSKPDPDEVEVEVKYNGYLHKLRAFKGDCREAGIQICLAKVIPTLAMLSLTTP